MKKRPFKNIIWFSLLLTLSWPQVVVALRDMGVDGQPVRAGLEQSLSAGFEEFHRVMVLTQEQ